VRRRWFRWGLIGLVVLAAWLGATHVIHVQRLEEQTRLAGEEIAAGRFEAARNRLRQVAAGRPRDERIAYDLGVCEERLGNHDAARAAWRRIAPGTALGARAAVASARSFFEQGRYGESERILLTALTAPLTGPEGEMAREQLVVLYRTEGRIREIRPLIEQMWALVRKAGNDPRWEEVSRPRDLLRQYTMVDLEEVASEGLRQTLAEAKRLAPWDDRVGLGLANLAVREGRYKEADLRLVVCEAKRPGDAATAQARLDWAMATGNVAQARSALSRLPDGWFGGADLLALRAWFTRQRSDTAAERHALEQLVECDPGRTVALERLAELALIAGDEPKVRSLRARKAALDELKNRYKADYSRADVKNRAAELAGWAEALGRRFEAEAWFTLLAEARPGDSTARENLARLAQTPPPLTGPALADLRAELALGSSSTHDRPAAAPAVQGEFHFVDDAAAAGLRFVYDNGQTPDRQLPETMGGGVGLLDFDGDGWLDVYCVQGGPLDREPDAKTAGDRLFRNRGNGTFADVTELAGLPAYGRDFGNGVAVGDYDNDGRPDLFVTRLTSYCLLRNRGNGTFEDVTESAGLAGQRDWPTSAAFADIDNDGDLDLYVCHYATWNVHRPRLCRRADGSPSYCPPRSVAPAQDRLFRNDGGRFVDVTSEAGIAGETGRGLGVVAADLNGDGRIDFFVANDGTANFLFCNLGGGRFAEAGHEAGVAASAEGGYQAGMGIACGDLDGDGKLDLAVTNFFGESSSLFQNLGGGMFADRTIFAGLAAATRHLLGFGVAFLDADNDGHLDLLIVNGHVTDNRPAFPFKMPAQLLAGDGTGRLVDVSDRAGAVFQVARLGRGLAVGDLDNDGRLDAVAVDQNRPLVILHNRSRGGHWIRFTLGGTDSNRDGVGALVTVHAGPGRWTAARLGGGSYQSASDPRVHFGLGAVERIDRVEVAWPSGRVDRFTDLVADADYRLREQAPAPVRLGTVR
jgi:enediyne biosynthesis protein E4